MLHTIYYYIAIRIEKKSTPRFFAVFFFLEKIRAIATIIFQSVLIFFLCFSIPRVFPKFNFRACLLPPHIAYTLFTIFNNLYFTRTTRKFACALLAINRGVWERESDKLMFAASWYVSKESWERLKVKVQSTTLNSSIHRGFFLWCCEAKKCASSRRASLIITTDTIGNNNYIIIIRMVRTINYRLWGGSVSSLGWRKILAREMYPY